MIIGYLRPSLYLCLMAIVWSGVSASMCGTTSFTGLVLVRFFLGVVEAPLLPGAVYLMGCWYTRREMAMRVAILYTGQTLAFCTAGLIAAAVFGTLDQVGSSLSKSEDDQYHDTNNNLAVLWHSRLEVAFYCPLSLWHWPCPDRTLRTTRLSTLTNR
jgi:MFS family permease